MVEGVMTMYRKSRGECMCDQANYVLLSLLAVATMYPIVYVLFASLSDPTLYMQHSGILWKPLDFNLKAYKLVFDNGTIMNGYINTMIIVVVGLSINILLTSLGA